MFSVENIHFQFFFRTSRVSASHSEQRGAGRDGGSAGAARGRRHYQKARRSQAGETNGAVCAGGTVKNAKKNVESAAATAMVRSSGLHAYHVVTADGGSVWRVRHGRGPMEATHHAMVRVPVCRRQTWRHGACIGGGCVCGRKRQRAVRFVRLRAGHIGREPCLVQTPV